MRLSGHSREGAVCLPSESRKSRPGAFWGRKTPLILTLTQSLHRQITHRLGGADAHCDMPILNAHSRRRAVPPLANCFRIKARVPVAVGLAALRVLPPPFIHQILCRRTATTRNSLTKFSFNLSHTTRKLQVFPLLAPVPLINGHRQTGDLRYIIPGKCHIVLVEHLQGTHHIILRKAVDVLHTHIVIGFQQRESVPAQLLLIYPAFLRIDRQRHNAIEAMAHFDLVLDPVQPPVIEISLDRPAAPPLLLDDSPLIPVRVLLLRLGQRESPLPHETQELLLLPVAVRDKLQQLLQRHPPSEPIGRHRVLPAQLGAGADYPEALQNALHLRFFYRGGISVPNLPSKGIFQLLQAFLVVRIHRHWLFQHII